MAHHSLLGGVGRPRAVSGAQPWQVGSLVRRKQARPNPPSTWRFSIKHGRFLTRNGRIQPGPPLAVHAATVARRLEGYEVEGDALREALEALSEPSV